MLNKTRSDDTLVATFTLGICVMAFTLLAFVIGGASLLG